MKPGRAKAHEPSRQRAAKGHSTHPVTRARCALSHSGCTDRQPNCTHRAQSASGRATCVLVVPGTAGRASDAFWKHALSSDIANSTLLAFNTPIVYGISGRAAGEPVHVTVDLPCGPVQDWYYGLVTKAPEARGASLAFICVRIDDVLCLSGARPALLGGVTESARGGSVRR
eukprot:566902-Rhodomonas_salina.1